MLRIDTTVRFSSPIFHVAQCILVTLYKKSSRYLEIQADPRS